MGLMIERSGIAQRAFNTLYLWLGNFRGGLAVATVLLGTALAACVGVIAASVTALALVALPTMLEHGYKKELACGSVCAGGTLGILIPPSVMLVFYGPMANISVGKLFVGAIVPGLMLSSLYIAYIVIWSFLKPEVAPSMPADQREAIPLRVKVISLFSSLVPMLILIVAVLGSIFMGIATPTEAAAVGFFAATLMAVVYRRLNWRVIKEVARDGIVITAMAFWIGGSASMFTGIFLGLGCGDVVANFVLATPFGHWGAFAMIMFIIFILGMFIDWLGIIFIMIPIITPIVPALGFDPLWFAMMICVNLQMSFMTPPFAYAIFYLQGAKKPEWGVEISHIIRGVIPFVGLIVVGLLLCITFPQIILWLPNLMIK
jgi:tripartite ATP-independent transporter DctM subunit